MDFLIFLLLTILAYSGLLFGIYLIQIAPEEQKPGMRYFKKIRIILFLIGMFFFLFYFKVNVFLIILVIFIHLLILNKIRSKYQERLTAAFYSLFGFIYPLSMINYNLIIIESVIIFLIGLTTAPLELIIKKKNYKDLLSKTIYFPIISLIIFTISLFLS